MKARIRFFATCFCAVMPVVALGWYLSANPMAYMDEEAPYYLWNREVANSSHEKYYSTIILGDSLPNAAFEPALLSDGTLNLSLGGTTAVENYYTMQDWLAHNPAPKVCYICFNDNHFKSEDCFWKRTIYMHRYSLSQNIEMMKSAIYYQEPSILTDDHLADFAAYERWAPSKYVTALINAKFNQRYEINRNAMQADDLHGGRYVSRGVVEYSSENAIKYDEFKVAPIFDAYYKKLIELCVGQGITVRLVKLPVANNAVYSEQYKQQFWAYYDELREAYPQVTVDWFPDCEQRYYRDDHHMNSHGALRFCTELKNLYPEDFASGEPSQAQIAAINDSIKGENKVDAILKWVCGRDYTVILCDTGGAFAPAYGDHIQKDVGAYGSTLELFSLEQRDALETYYISGLNSEDIPCDVRMTESGVDIQFGAEPVQTWTAGPGNMLGVIVIDDSNDSVVCMKSFKWEADAYTLV